MTTTTLPENCPATDTYRDVEKLIWHVCNEFWSKHGGNIDDLVEVGNIVFWEVYRNWKPGKAPFTSYLSTCLYRRLLEEKRKLRRVPTIPMCGDSRKGSKDRDIPEPLPPSFNLEDLYEEMSADAYKVISLIFNTPPEIAAIIEAKGGKERNIRSTLREHLHDIGWSLTRITAAFEEIRMVLAI